MHGKVQWFNPKSSQFFFDVPHGDTPPVVVGFFLAILTYDPHARCEGWQVFACETEDETVDALAQIACNNDDLSAVVLGAVLNTGSVYPRTVKVDSFTYIRDQDDNMLLPQYDQVWSKLQQAFGDKMQRHDDQELSETPGCTHEQCRQRSTQDTDRIPTVQLQRSAVEGVMGASNGPSAHHVTPLQGTVGQHENVRLGRIRNPGRKDGQ